MITFKTTTVPVQRTKISLESETEISKPSTLPNWTLLTGLAGLAAALLVSSQEDAGLDTVEPNITTHIEIIPENYYSGTAHPRGEDLARPIVDNNSYLKEPEYFVLTPGEEFVICISQARYDAPNMLRRTGFYAHVPFVMSGQSPIYDGYFSTVDELASLLCKRKPTTARDYETARRIMLNLNENKQLAMKTSALDKISTGGNNAGS